MHANEKTNRLIPSATLAEFTMRVDDDDVTPVSSLSIFGFGLVFEFGVWSDYTYKFISI